MRRKQGLLPTCRQFGSDPQGASGAAISVHRSCRHHNKLRHPTRSDQLPKSLAERRSRTLGWYCKYDLLDHVIVLNERHLNRLMGEYIRYYHGVRTGLALEKQNAQGRVAATDPEVSCEVVSMPRLGGLHHRYELAS
jgi:hypothetical protein